MKLLALLAFLVLVAAPTAAAKDIESIVVAGSDGRSITIEPERAVLAVMLYHPASVYNVRPVPVRPRGGYVRVYPLGRGGFPAVPGRFYPATRALCFGWNQARASIACARLEPPRQLIAASRRLALFYDHPTVVARLRPGGTVNLFTALELAFDRHRMARSTRRPARCLPFVVTWRGAGAAQRPTSVCVSRGGVYAKGRLYPAGRAVWWLALNA